MRINKYIAQKTGISRRSADKLLISGRIKVNDKPALIGQDITDTDEVIIDQKKITKTSNLEVIMLNKPVGYISSRNGQGGKTIYNLLPPELHNLKAVGRLDKLSSGLLLMTNDGDLSQSLTHPSNQKLKIYSVILNRPLNDNDKKLVSVSGIMLEDGISKFEIKNGSGDKSYFISMTEGRNRQIRRTFKKLGYFVKELHRQSFGEYQLGSLATGKYKHLII